MAIGALDLRFSGNIGSIDDFIGLTQNGKSVFVRLVGENVQLRNDVEKMDGIGGYYIRLSSLPQFSSGDDTNYYVKAGEDLSAVSIRISQTDRVLQAKLGEALREALRVFRLAKGSNESVEKNFKAKLLFRLDKVFEGVPLGGGVKLVCTDVTKLQEYLFFYVAAILGVNVLLLQTQSDIDASAESLRISRKVVIGPFGSTKIPEFTPQIAKRSQRPSPVQQSPIRQNPAPVQRAPIRQNPAPVQQSPIRQNPAPVQRAPIRQNPAPVQRSPIRQNPAPVQQSPIRQNPAPVQRAPIRQNPAPVQQSPIRQNPAPVQPSPIRQSPPPVQQRNTPAVSARAANMPPVIQRPQNTPISPIQRPQNIPYTPIQRPQNIEYTPITGNYAPRDELSYEELAQLASSVVQILVIKSKSDISRDGRMKVCASGSGVMIGASGYIITNCHVVTSGKIYAVRIENDDNVYFTDRIIKYHDKNDLAILKIDRHLSPLAIYDGRRPLVRGQKVVAIGSPMGMFNSVSDGIISGFRNMDDTNMIQFTAPISSGSSGGAVLNMYGEIIGISTMGIAPDEGVAQNLNLAVSYETLRSFCGNLIASS